MRKQAQEAEQLLSELIGVSVPSSTSVSNLSSNIQEYYQLPIRVGVEGKPLDEGNDKPWFVGYFSPTMKTESHPTGHQGIDQKSSKGTPIHPIASGEILETGVGEKSGNYIKISHENGKITSFYAHLETIKVQKGEEVNQKTEIGTVGDTGNAKGRGAHLHFEVKVNGANVDPLSVMGKVVGSVTKSANLEKLLGYFWRLG